MHRRPGGSKWVTGMSFLNGKFEQSRQKKFGRQFSRTVWDFISCLNLERFSSAVNILWPGQACSFYLLFRNKAGAGILITIWWRYRFSITVNFTSLDRSSPCLRKLKKLMVPLSIFVLNVILLPNNIHLAPYFAKSISPNFICWLR